MAPWRAQCVRVIRGAEFVWRSKHGHAWSVDHDPHRPSPSSFKYQTSPGCTYITDDNGDDIWEWWSVLSLSFCAMIQFAYKRSPHTVCRCISTTPRPVPVQVGGTRWTRPSLLRRLRRTIHGVWVYRSPRTTRPRSRQLSAKPKSVDDWKRQNDVHGGLFSCLTAYLIVMLWQHQVSVCLGLYTILVHSTCSSHFSLSYLLTYSQDHHCSHRLPGCSY